MQTRDEVEGLNNCREIPVEKLPVAKVLYTKSCTRNQFLFCKKMLSKLQIFLAKNVSLSEKKLTELDCKDFPSVGRRRNG